MTPLRDDLCTSSEHGCVTGGVQKVRLRLAKQIWSCGGSRDIAWGKTARRLSAQQLRWPAFAWTCGLRRSRLSAGFAGGNNPQAARRFPLGSNPSQPKAVAIYVLRVHVVDPAGGTTNTRVTGTSRSQQADMMPQGSLTVKAGAATRRRLHSPQH